MSCPLQLHGLSHLRPRRSSVLSLSLVIWCLFSYALYSTFPGTSPQLRQRNASLAQAGAVSRQLRELSLQKLSCSVLLSAFSKAGQLLRETESAAFDLNAFDTQFIDSQQLETMALRVLMAIADVKPVVLCVPDPSLLFNTSLEGNKLLLAANMHNNEDLLPHFTLQLLEFLSSVPDGSVFVSIYESDSTDSTGKMVAVTTADLSHVPRSTLGSNAGWTLVCMSSIVKVLSKQCLHCL